MEALIWHIFNYFIYTILSVCLHLGTGDPVRRRRKKRPFALTPASFPSSLLVMRKKRPAAARRYVYTGGAEKYIGKQKNRQLWILSPPEQKNGRNMDSFHTEAWGKVLQSKIVPPVERVWLKRRYRQKRHLCGGYLPKIAKNSLKNAQNVLGSVFGCPWRISSLFGSPCMPLKGGGRKGGEMGGGEEQNPLFVFKVPFP